MRRFDKEAYRRKWQQMEALEDDLLRQQSVHQSVAEFERLRSEFRPFLEAEGEEARADRFVRTAELQHRLRRLASVLRERGHGSAV